MLWKNRFDMRYLQDSEPDVFAADMDGLRKEFDKLDGDLRAIQGKYEPREKQVAEWNISQEKKEAELTKIIGEKENERKPLVDKIRPLNEKIQRCEQILALYKKCEEKDLEIMKYIVILERVIKNKEYRFFRMWADDLNKKSNTKIGNDYNILG